MAEHDENQDQGLDLIKRGWRQGVLIEPPTDVFQCHSHVRDESGVRQEVRTVRPKERLVVVSQDCDIRADFKREPTIEALICTNSKPSSPYLVRLDRRYSREFVVDPAAGLVANARYRLQIDKRILQALTPLPWPSSEERLKRFARWLGLRYSRPAVPDGLYEGFQRPIDAALTRLEQDQQDIARTLSEAVHELRMSLPVTEDPPYDLGIVLLTVNRELTTAEVDAIDYLTRELPKLIDQSQVTISYIVPRNEEELSVHDYFNTVALDADYLSYQGESVIGAQPLAEP